MSDDAERPGPAGAAGSTPAPFDGRLAGRRRASPLGALRAELVLLREENARLKAAQHQRPDIGRLLGRARSLPAADRPDSGDRATTRADAGRRPRDPRVAAGDLPGDRAGDGRLRGAAERARHAPVDRRRRSEPTHGRPWPWPERRPPRDGRPPRRAAGSRPRPAAAPAHPAHHRGHVPVRAWAASARGATCSSAGLTEFDWQVLPIVAPARRGRRCTSCPPHAREVGRDRGVVRGAAARRAPRRCAPRAPSAARRARRATCSAGRATPTAVLEAWSVPPPPRRRAPRVPLAPRLGGVPRRPARGARRARPGGRHAAGARPRRGGARSTRRSTGSRARPRRRRRATDVLHVTAAGWSAIPALVHKALHGTPMVLTEHGVYVREAYLAAVAQRRLAGHALRRHAAGPRPRARRPTRAPTSSAR